MNLIPALLGKEKFRVKDKMYKEVQQGPIVDHRRHFFKKKRYNRYHSDTSLFQSSVIPETVISFFLISKNVIYTNGYSMHEEHRANPENTRRKTKKKQKIGTQSTN